ncbi:MAG: hypothetical protein AAB250_10400 [Bdellovibrionota bacterium]
MAEFHGLTSLKHALLAPLSSKPRTTTQHKHNATCYVDRHDHHNIEIKTVSDIGSAPSTVETDIFLFVPRSFEVASFEKSDLSRDWRTRMRLSAPVTGEQGAAAFEDALATIESSRKRLEGALEAGDAPVVDIAHPMCEEAIEATRDLCAIVTGSLKHGATEESRSLFLSHSVFTTEDSCISSLKRLKDHAGATREVIARVRNATRSAHAAAAAIFAILDEYLSQAYIQYLNTVRTELERVPMPASLANSGYELEHARTIETLDRLQSEEAKYRVRFGSCATGAETELERESRLLRLSQLKKFFQSKSFVDVTRQHPATKFSESTALVGTAAAAGIAAFVQWWFFDTRFANTATSAFIVVTVGVIVYVLRDRLKDRAKETLRQHAMRILPDSEQHLMAQDHRIGTVKEWLRVRDAKDLPQSVLQVRRASSAHEMEKRLPEDVLHCRRVQEVDPSSLVGQGGTLITRSLHENTRINFDRYLKHMDDPFKELIDLDPSGRFQQSLSHRVYHFYICVKTIARPQMSRWSKKLLAAGAKPAQTHEQTLLYRIVLDKNGIVRVEDLATRTSQET